MPHGSQKSLKRCLDLLEQCVQEDPILAAERPYALQEFFSDRIELPGQAQAELRFREWFLFERPSQRYGEPPVASLYETLQQRIPREHEDFSFRILDHAFGAFEVVEEDSGGGATLKDLLTQREYVLSDAGAAGHLRVGDAVVGRVFSSGAEDFILSPNTGICIRTPGVLEALRKDLHTARREHPGGKLSQREFEKFFWSRTADFTQLPLEEIEHRWEALTAGCGPTLRFAAVRQEILEAAQPGQAIVDVLNRLAFETEVSLDAARVLLLNLRGLLHPRKAEEQKPLPAALRAERHASCPCGSGVIYSDCCLGKDAVMAFEQGKARGEDLDKLFRDLEDAMGIESEEDSGAGDPIWSESEIPLLLQEFLWEKGPAIGGATEALESFAGFLEKESNPGVSHIEEISAEHFGRFLTAHLFQSPAGKNPKAAAATLSTLSQFCQWADEAQGTNLVGAFEPIRSAVEPHLERIIAANACLPETEKPGAAHIGKVIRWDDTLIHVGADGEQHVVDDIPAPLLALLRQGDVVEFSKSAKDGKNRLIRIYPPASQSQPR